MVTASALSLSSAYKASSFQKLTPYPHVLFHVKSFLWKGPLAVKVRKNIFDQILGYISFYFEIFPQLGLLFV